VKARIDIVISAFEKATALFICQERWVTTMALKRTLKNGKGRQLRNFTGFEMNPMPYSTMKYPSIGGSMSRINNTRSF
jgi:hypothetical protein